MNLRELYLFSFSCKNASFLANICTSSKINELVISGEQRSPNGYTTKNNRISGNGGREGKKEAYPNNMTDKHITTGSLPSGTAELRGRATSPSVECQSMSKITRAYRLN